MENPPTYSSEELNNNDNAYSGGDGGGGSSSFSESSSSNPIKEYAEGKVNDTINSFTGPVNETKNKIDAVMNNPNASIQDKALSVGLTLMDGAESLKNSVEGLKNMLSTVSEDLMMPVLGYLSQFKGQATLPIAKQLDPVIGIDIHFYLVPPGVPTPLPSPYLALLFRPRDFISCIALSIIPTPERAEGVDEKSTAEEVSQDNIRKVQAKIRDFVISKVKMGASVKIGPVIPRVTAGTPSINIPHRLMPIFGPLVSPRDKGHSLLGSLFVLADNMPLTGGLVHLHNDCWDIGIPTIHDVEPDAKAALYVPSGVILPIPWNQPVLTNWIPTPINPMTIFERIVKAALGKLVNHITKKDENGCSRLSKALHNLNSKIKDAFPNLHKKLDKLISTHVGHPIDVAGGYLFTDEEDFSLPGIIPVSFERIWYSDSTYQGPLGHGWHHSYDMALLIDEEAQIAQVSLQDGRVAVFDKIPLSHEESPRFHRTEKLFFHKHADGFYYLEDKKGLIYNFSVTPVRLGEIYMLTSIANRNGYAVRLKYNTTGELIEIIDTTGRIVNFENEEGKIRRITTSSPTDKNETIILGEYFYTKEGDLIQQKNALGDSMYFEYKNHLLVKETWRNGVPFYFKYEGTEVGSQCVETWGENGFLHYRLQYEDGKTVVTDSLGNVTTYLHKDGIVYDKTDPEGNSWKTVFNEFDEIEGTENPLGQISGSTYDDKGNVLTVRKEDGRFMQFEYNDPDSPFFPTEAIDNRGGKWKWHYDMEGNLIKKVNPEGAVTQFKYTDGLITKIINPDQTKTLLEYDNQYNLSKITFPNGTHEEMFYDLHGRNIKQVDVQGNYIFRNFDVAGRITALTLPDGNRKKMEYDAMDNLIRYKDNQYEVTMEYNVFNKLKTRKQGNTQLEFTYNAEGQLKQIVNEKKETYHFLFDKNGRVKEEISFDGLRTRYHRDAVGKVLATLKGEKRKTLYHYDPNGYIERIKYHDGLEEFFEYENGMLSEAYSTYARVNFERDALGRVIKETCDGHEVTSTYNAMGDRIHIGSSLGADIHLDYDDMGNLVSQKTHGWEADMLRDTYGLEIERNLTGGIHSRWERDKVGRISRHWVTHKDHLGIRTRYQRSYTWDTNYKLRQLVDQNGQATSFEYDVYGNLSQTEYADGTVQFRKPDETGNLFETPERTDRLYSKGGKLLKTRNARYEYDEVGNLIKKTTREGEWLYEWHGNGTLRRVRRPDGQDVWFRYDPLGRRTAKKFKNTTTRWVWDGNKPLHEWKEFEAREATPEEITTWVFDENSFIPVAKLRGEKKYSILADHLGTPVQMYKEDGELFWDSSLDSYGRLKLNKGESGSCPFRYQGQYEDVETGLYYNRFRYYNPEEGLYLSQDPIKLKGGTQFYSYVHDPNGWIDPLGLNETEPTSNEARREVMRQAGIPTSQQPVSQSKNDSGYEYTYEVPTEGGGTKLVTVQQQTMDSSHKNEAHWEAGTVKVRDGEVQKNKYGRPKIENEGKQKMNYSERHG